MIREEFEIWRLIFENIATLQELETIWSLDDVLRANAILNMKQDLATLAKEKARKVERTKN